MDEVELQRMIVRLVGDGSSYEKMIASAQENTKKTAEVVENATKHVDGFGRSLNRFAEASISGLELYKVKGFLKGAFDEFAGDEERMLRLSAAIRQNGRNAEAGMAQYNKFGEALNKSTGHSKDATQDLLLTAESMGQFGKSAELAAKNAIYLSAAIGGEASSYIMVTEAINTGNAAMLGRIRQLRGLKTDSEKIARVQSLIAQGEAQSKVLMESSLGVLKRYRLAWEDLYESFGEVVSQGVKPVVKVLSDILDMFNESSDSSKKFMIGATLVLTAILSFGPAMALIRATAVPLWDMMNDGIVSLFSPMKLLMAGVGILAALWIDDLGGVVAAWEEVKKAVDDFWQEVRPIWDAVKDFLKELKDQARITFRELSRAARQAFRDLMDYAARSGIDVKKTFQEIRDTIVTSFEFAEFSLTHFKMVSQLAWAAIKLAAVSAADFIAENVFYFLYATVAVTMFRRMLAGWISMWSLMAVAALAAVAVIGFALGKAIAEALKGALKGKSSKEILEGFKKEFSDTIGSAIGEGLKLDVGGFGIEPLKNAKAELIQEVAAMGGDVGKAFEKWRTDKWWQKIFAQWAGGGKVFEKAKDDIVPPIKKIEGELKGLDAALVGSAEAIRRIAAYRDKLMEGRGPQTVQPVGGDKFQAKAFVPDVAKWMEKQPGLEKELADRAAKLAQAQADFHQREATKDAFRLTSGFGGLGLSHEIISKLIEPPQSLDALRKEKEALERSQEKPFDWKQREIQQNRQPGGGWGTDPKVTNLLTQIKDALVKGDTITVKRAELI